MSERTGSCPPRRGCPPFYVSQGTYTVTCPDGRAVTVTREGRSSMSVAHAHQLALGFAKREAERQARCICYSPSAGMPYNYSCPPPEGPNFRFKAGTHEFQLFNFETGKYHPVSVVEDGAPVLLLGDAQD